MDVGQVGVLPQLLDVVGGADVGVSVAVIGHVEGDPVITRSPSTMVIAVPFVWLRDGAHPLAADL
ncbi:MAG: hypothetical protein WAL72_40120 [Streptosporangiaceae bacterium]